MNTYDIWGCNNDSWIWIMKIVNNSYIRVMFTRSDNYATVRQIVDALESMD